MRVAAAMTSSALLFLLAPFAGALAQDAGEPPDAGEPADAGAIAEAPPAWKFPFAFAVELASPIRRPKVDAESRVLVDLARAGAEKASLVLVAAPSSVEVWPHRHQSAELAYVLEGTARVRGTSRNWVDLSPGDAVYLAPGVAHGWFWSGSRERPTRLLVLHAPPLPEPAFASQEGTPLAASEVRKPDPKAPQPKVMKAASAPSYSIAGGKGSVRIYFDAESAGDSSAYLGVMKAEPGMAVPEHLHPAEAELLYVLEGGGELSADGKVVSLLAGTAVHMPAGRRHSFRVTSQAGFQAVQFYAPSGPEQRFKPKR
ncbi:MAG: cupin domain-containing protein [Myxococcales bacterium]|nr:cupin domain-containing protein [Myxococcales bacterium]